MNCLSLFLAFTSLVLNGCSKFGNPGELVFSDQKATGITLLQSTQLSESSQLLNWSTDASIGVQTSFPVTSFLLEYSLSSTLSNAISVPNLTPPYTLQGLSPGAIYFYRITEMAGGQILRTSSIGSFTVMSPAPGKPIFGSPISRETSLEIPFTPGSNASEHQLFYSTDPGLQNPILLSNPSNPISLTSLSAGTEYHLYIRAKNTSGQNDSDVAHFRTLDLAPPAPTALTAVADLSSIQFSWRAGSGAGSTTSFFILFGVNPTLESNLPGLRNLVGPIVPGTPSTSYLAQGLNPGTQYYYQVIAKNLTRETASAILPIKTRPSAPVISLPMTITSSSVTLSWQPVPGADSYDVVLGQVNQTSPTTQNTQSSTITLSGLISDQSYSLQVIAKNTSGSTPSTTQVFRTQISPPGIPQNLSAVPSQNSAILSWSPNQTGGTPTEYLLTSGTTNPPTGTPVTVSATSFTLSSLTPGTTYFVSVAAKNSAGTSSAVPLSFQTTLNQGAPTLSSVTSITSSGATLNWTVSGGASAPTGFRMKYAKTQALLASATATSLASSLRSYALTSLDPGTQYFYEVAAVYSATSSFASQSSWITTPVAPASITPVATETSITLSWTSTNGSSTTYSIAYGPTSSLGSTQNSVTSTVTLPASAGSTLFYKVTANAGSLSASSAVLSSQTLSAPPVITAGMGSMTASSVKVDWSAVTGATSYTLKYSLFSDLSQATTISGITALTQTISSLQPATRYYLVAYANSAAGASAPSNTLNVLTSPLAPSAPVITTISVNTGNSATITWQAGSGGGTVDSYLVEWSLDSSFQTNVFSSGRLSGILTHTLAGLSLGSTYFYRVTANNSTASTSSSIGSLITAPATPILSLGPVRSQITPADTYSTTVTFTGSSTSGTLTYGLDPLLLNNSTSISNFASGQSVSGLFGSRTYYFRISVSNSSATAQSSPATLPIPIEAPKSPIAAAASSVTNNSAILTWTPGSTVSLTSFTSSGLYGFLKTNCVGCHSISNGTVGSGYRLSQHASTDANLAHQSLVGTMVNTFPGTARINVINPEESGLYKIINSGHMGVSTALAPTLLTFLKDWVKQGALAGGISLSYKVDLGTSTPLSGAGIAATSPHTASLSSGTSYFFRVLALNSSSSPGASSTLTFTTSGTTTGNGDTPAASINFESELRLVDRRYVDSMLRDLFGPISAGGAADTAITSNILTQASLGGACDTYAAKITAVDEGRNLITYSPSNEQCFSGMSAVLPAQLNSARFALVAKACDALLSDATARNAILTKVFGGTLPATIPAPASATLTTAYQLFYPLQTPSSAVITGLTALGNTATTNNTDKWIRVMYGICSSPEWQVQH